MLAKRSILLLFNFYLCKYQEVFWGEGLGLKVGGWLVVSKKGENRNKCRFS
ncbi:hypothetical protein HanIR_Chr02g0057901 [Helianthus annuus]|nr:hypothetical protein HanIR_Chr02g0057901 [Helianthus annuus]